VHAAALPAYLSRHLSPPFAFNATHPFISWGFLVC
jgi:hypothetical protein